MSFDPAAVASLFSFRDKIVSLAAGPVVTLVEACPTRNYLSVIVAGGSVIIGPSTKITTTAGISVTTTLPFVMKYADQPALVTSQWFMAPTGAGQAYIIEGFGPLG